MNKSTDIDKHPASYMVLMYNDGDETTTTDYFEQEEDATKRFGEVKDAYDYSYLFRLMECSEAREV